MPLTRHRLAFGSRALPSVPLASAIVVVLALAGASAPLLGLELVVETERGAPLLRGVPGTITLRAVEASGATTVLDATLPVRGLTKDGEPVGEVRFSGGEARLEGVVVDDQGIVVDGGGVTATVHPPSMPGILTVLPALVAIILAVLTRQVIVSLFFGVWTGAFLMAGYRPLASLLATADRYLVPALADEGHASILIFSLSLAGLVGVITANGGVRGIVEAVSRRATSARSGQLATWFLGLVIFFDDYANSLIVGNTMRPFSDRLRISREKLAFIVDATAAPIATIGVISTWTAYQVGLLDGLLPLAPEGTTSGYAYFIESIAASFYSFLVILLVFLSAATQRDLGAMRRAEERARQTGSVLRDGASPLLDPSLDELALADGLRPRWYAAAIPIACVVGFTLWGLWHTGTEALGPDAAGASVRDIFANADSYRALLWASLGATSIAITLSLIHGMSLESVMGSWVSGVKSLVLAAVILVFAWSIGAVCSDLGTGAWVVSVAEGTVSPRLLPVLAFVLAGIIAFATGTSYGTMGILVPILLPLTYELGATDAIESGALDVIGHATFAAILGGAVFGDHCSPISDTTVLSSMASGSDHIDHVRTQLPYALLAASVAAPCYLAVGLGLPKLAALGAGLAVLTILFLWLSRRVDDTPRSGL